MRPHAFRVATRVVRAMAAKKVFLRALVGRITPAFRLSGKADPGFLVYVGRVFGCFSNSLAKRPYGENGLLQF